jgi:hypothetical protein
MKLEELLPLLPENFASLAFAERVTEVSKHLGNPTTEWATYYPSGGGTSYAYWKGGAGTSGIRLEVGGWDIHTGGQFARLPYRWR